MSPIRAAAVGFLTTLCSAQVPDRYENALTAFQFGNALPASLHVVVAPGYRVTDLNVLESGAIAFTAVDATSSACSFFDPNARLDVNVPEALVESGIRSLGLRPVALTGYANSSGQLVYAVSCETDRGRSWQYVTGGSPAALSAWLATHPGFRPYFIDRADVGPTSTYVMLAELTPAGEGGASLLFGLSPSQVQQAIVPGVSFVSAIQEAGNGQALFDVVVQEFGPTRRPYHTEFVVGPNTDVYRPGQFWSGTERVFSVTDFTDSSGTLTTAYLAVDDAYRFRRLDYVAACATGSGTVPELQLTTATDVRPGATVNVDLVLADASAPTLFAVGLSRDSWQGLQLPVDLASSGAPGCELGVAVDLQFPMVTSVSGSAQVSLNLPGFLVPGTRLYVQAVTGSTGANPAGVVVTAPVLIEVE